MHEVEGVGRLRPVEGRIVELEAEVWRNEGWLDGGDVGGDDFGGGELVGEIADGGYLTCSCEWKGIAYIAQMPVPVPISITFYPRVSECYRFWMEGANLRIVSNWRQKEFTVQKQSKHMVSAKIRME